MNGIEDSARIQPSDASDNNTKKFVASFRQRCYDAMNDDLMTLPSSLICLRLAMVNILIDHKAQISADDLKELTEAMQLLLSTSWDSRTGAVLIITMHAKRHTERL